MITLFRDRDMGKKEGNIEESTFGCVWLEKDKLV